MRLFQACAILTAPFIMTAVAAAGTDNPSAHEHGKAKGSIAVEEKTVVVELEIPSDDIFGFEHATKSKEQKDAVTKALDTLRGKTLEVINLPSENGCRATEIKVESSLEGEPKNLPKDKNQVVHSDVDIRYTFTCDKVEGLNAKLGLLKLFPRIKAVDLQVLTAKAQSKVTVTKSDTVIPL